MDRRRLFMIVGGPLACLLIGLIVVSVAMCGGDDEKVVEAPTNPTPHPSRGEVGGVRIPVRRATAAELGYTTDPSPPPRQTGHLPLAGEEEIVRLEDELAIALEEEASAREEARQLREQEARERLVVNVAPLAVGLAGSSLTPPMDWEGWEEMGNQDIPESPLVLHCGSPPSGYRSRGDERYLHRFTADGYFLVFIDGRWARATGQVEDLWMDLGTDGRGQVRRKHVTFCRAGATAYVRQDTSAPPGEITLLRFGENVGSARGISYLGGVTYSAPAHLAPGSVLTCPATDCDQRWRGSETATRYFGWLKRTYTPSPGDVNWAD